MLESLGRALSAAFSKLKKKTLVGSAEVKEFLRDLQRALLAGDVKVELVFQLTENIKRRLESEKPLPGITLKEHLINLAYEELVKIMGKGAPTVPRKKGTVIMFVGIQGSGKTTTVAKYAYYLKKKKKQVGVICADTWRPAACKQLHQLLDPHEIPVFDMEGEKDPVKIVKKGLKRFHDKDVILIDTAGRHKDEAGLMAEMRKLYSEIIPDEVILVIDAAIGQQAYSQAKAFAEATAVGSIVITKLDGSAKGGGAISAAAAANAPIKFIGVGEKIEDLEPFDPVNFVGRLLGMPNLKGLLEKIKDAQLKISHKTAIRILKGRMTLRDFYQQIQQLSKIGPMDTFFAQMGVKLDKEGKKELKRRLKTWKIIMDSMTEEELDNPRILNHSRIKRISRGSGIPESEIRLMLKQYKKSLQAMRKMNKRKLAQMFARMGMSPEF